MDTNIDSNSKPDYNAWMRSLRQKAAQIEREEEEEAQWRRQAG